MYTCECYYFKEASDRSYSNVFFGFFFYKLLLPFSTASVYPFRVALQQIEYDHSFFLSLLTLHRFVRLSPPPLPTPPFLPCFSHFPFFFLVPFFPVPFFLFPFFLLFFSLSSFPLCPTSILALFLLFHLTTVHFPAIINPLLHTVCVYQPTHLIQFLK